MTEKPEQGNSGRVAIALVIIVVLVVVGIAVYKARKEAATRTNTSGDTIPPIAPAGEDIK